MAFGQNINPGYMNVDYSALSRIGASNAGRYERTGQAAGKAAQAIVGLATGMPMSGEGGVAGIFQQQKQMEQEANSVASIAELISKKSPDLIPGVGDIAARLKDKEIPLSQRIQEAISFKEGLGLSFKIQEQQREEELFNLQKQRMQQSMAQSAAPQGLSPFGGAPILPQAAPQPAPQGFTYPQ